MSLLLRAARLASRATGAPRRFSSRVVSPSASFAWHRVVGGAAVLGVAAASISTTSTAAAAASAAPAASESITSRAPFVPSATKVRVGLVQLAVGADKDANLKEAAKQVALAAEQGAKMIVLPEMFNCPYSNASFNPYSERLPSVGASASSICPSTSPSAAFMSALAKQHGVYLVAGSMPEKADPERGQSQHAKSGLAHHLYNTCLVFSPEGTVVAKHRKVHLFDIDVPGKMTFKESDTLSAGNQATLFDTPWARIGLGICYDIRFGEYATMLTERGATMLIYPGAFNTTTGPLHWELLQRARAVDNQLWVLTCSPARSTDAKAYQAWGHSSAISPWGRVVATTEHQPAVVVADVDMAEVNDMRTSIPVRSQKRNDLYRLQC